MLGFFSRHSLKAACCWEVTVYYSLLLMEAPTGQDVLSVRRRQKKISGLNRRKRARDNVGLRRLKREDSRMIS